MNIPPRTPPRFLPTLTQVVDPSSLGLTSIAAAMDPEQLVQTVLQKVDAALMNRLRQQMEESLQLQWQTLGPSLRNELEPLARALVSETLASRMNHDEPK